ncbi:hypothetical protein [Photobacterium ganghwense]|nr:hypothetical protein [Photobacterium ganghwense]
MIDKSRKQKAESRKQKAESRKQKAESRITKGLAAASPQKHQNAITSDYA